MCPRLYKYHYIDRIRSTRGSSALYFGQAIDEALNILLENKDDPGALQDSLEVYNKYMSKWQHKYDIDFFRADADKRILTEDDISHIDNLAPEFQDHAFGWFSLLRKGYEFIRKYNEDIIPNIKEVKSVQEKISKRDQYGNEIIGYIDSLHVWSDPTNPDASILSICDNKTSSSSYAKSKIENSRQLNLYAWALGLDDISYVVCRKDLNAKGEIRPIQVLHGKRNDDIINEVLGDIQSVIDANESGEFPRTTKRFNCTKQFGRPCPYLDICRNGKEVSDCKHLEQK